MLPFLNNVAQHSKQYIVGFQGLNLGEGWADGEYSDCRNISTALAPCVTQRWGRVQEATYEAATALHAKNGLLVIDGGNVLYKGEVVGTVEAGTRKQMASIGNIVVIFPDKAYYNVETGDFGSMEETYEAAAGTLTFTDATITSSGDAFNFKVGDAVTISGCGVAENNKTIIVRGVEGSTLTFYENSFTAGTESEAVTIKREVPDLDFICESNFRLWGTKGNTIHASAYNDPFNFQVFDGLTGDSYYIDTSTDGEFTGCIPYSTHICFFKENALYKLYGSKPSNYQVTVSQVYGVQAGCERSMCIINETLIYKGVNGFYAYTGGVPELISAKFGTVRFSEACAASDGERYYVSMRRGGDWGLYVYDVLRDLWVQEDELHAVDMAWHDGHVYLLDVDGVLWSIDREADIGNLEWSLTFCPFNETMNERKGYSKFHIRMELAAKAWLTVEVKRDHDRVWERVYTTHNERRRNITVPILPARCDSVEIRISGKGRCLLRTFIREFFVGSDV